MRAIHTNEAPAAIGPYSQGIIVNNLFYSSGQIPLTPEGKMVEGNIEAQTSSICELKSCTKRSRCIFGHSH